MNRNLVYFLTVTISLSFLYLLVLFFVKKVQKKKTKLLEKRKNFEAMTTESPIEDNFQESLERGLENIETRFSFFRKFMGPFFLSLWGILIVIPYLEGASRTYTSILVAIITVLISLAARPFIENLFAGMVLSFSNTARIGDTVEIDNQYGVIEEINLTFTTLKTWDWKRYLVPNSKLISKEFLNYSLHDKYVWASILFYVEAGTNIELLKEDLIKIISKSQYFDQKNYEEPRLWCSNLEKDSIQLWLAAWATTPANGWLLKSDMRMAVVETAKKQGIKFQLGNHQISTKEQPPFSS
ncbi:MAG: hypothetical protein CME60_06015 [Halobacteriovoraceae bacterium]|nr:hypothetical protein [Halobacteriovoraceae bacterium]